MFKHPNGVMVIQELVRLAKQGSGWLYYAWPNPAHGNQQEPKLGYVVKVDDGWFLGSGTYGPAATTPQQPPRPSLPLPAICESRAFSAESPDRVAPP